jgi:UDP-N-acetylglucosamine 2-epimerase (non-hydrolysing)
MIDTLLGRLDAARASNVQRRPGLRPGAYVAATLHRPSNVDREETLRVCLDSLASIAARMTVVLPLHPRTRQRVESLGLGELLGRLVCIEPIGYTEMLSLTDGAAAVLTDSGGLQEETTALGIPCVTLREQTERPVTIDQGTNRLAPWPLSRDGIQHAVEDALSAGRRIGPCGIVGWDGRAAERAVQALTGGPTLYNERREQ